MDGCIGYLVAQLQDGFHLIRLSLSQLERDLFVEFQYSNAFDAGRNVVHVPSGCDEHDPRVLFPTKQATLAGRIVAFSVPDFVVNN